MGLTKIALDVRYRLRVAWEKREIVWLHMISLQLKFLKCDHRGTRPKWVSWWDYVNDSHGFMFLRREEWCRVRG